MVVMMLMMRMCVGGALLEEDFRVRLDFLHFGIGGLTNLLELGVISRQGQTLLDIIDGGKLHTGQLLQRTLNLRGAVRAINLYLPSLLHGDTTFL